MKGTLAQLNSSMQLCAAGVGAGSGGSGGGGCKLPLQPQIEQMRSQYDALLTAMRQQQSELVSFHDAMESMVSQVKPPLDTIKRLAREIDPGIHLPELDVPEVHLPEVHLPPLPSIDELKAELGTFGRQQQAEAQVYLQQAVGSTESWQTSVADATGDLSGLLDDYSPPPFNTTAARLQMDGESTRFLEDQQAALSAFATPSERALLGLNGSRQAFNDSFDFSSVPSLFSQSGLRFEPLSQSSLDFNLLTMAMANVAWIATACDFVWRFWRSARLVIHYWSKAAVGLPTLDLRERDTQASAAVATACAELGKSPQRLFGACLTSPASGFGIALVAAFLIFNAATAVYMPMYFNYVDGCISPPRNGTFLSRNLFSVSYNYAATEGNQRLLHGLDLYHSARAANCSVELRESANEQRNLERQAQAAQQAYQQALDNVRLMRSCLRVDDLDAAAASAGVQPYLPLSAVLAPEACNVGALHEQAVRLDDGVYNCSAVAPCESACDGPSRAITATFCQRCGCHTEWLGHGMVLHLLLALLVFASINACRVLLVDGACRLLWRQLFAGQFDFLANCDDCGVPNVGRPQILEALRAAVRDHFQSGWLMVAGAVALNLPWVVALNYVGEHLAVGHSVEPGDLS